MNTTATTTTATTAAAIKIAGSACIESLETSRVVSHVRNRIRDTWTETVSRLPERAQRRMPKALPAKPKLLGRSTKTMLGDGLGVLTAVIYMSPASEAGVNTCPNATAQCAAACLGHSSGQLTYSTSKTARIWKTGLLMGCPEAFGRLLGLEIKAHAKKALNVGMEPALRIDGSSDTGLGDLIWLAASRYGVRVYDYTKSYARAMTSDRLTFSHSGPAALIDSQLILRAGGAVAVVFDTRKGQDLPATWQGFRVIDGDLSDARFLDREEFGLDSDEGYVVGLRFKGSQRKAAGEFVQKA